MAHEVPASTPPARWPAFPDEDDILDAVGGATFARGYAYAEQDRVLWNHTDARSRTLYAAVEGSSLRPYSVLVQVGGTPQRPRSTGHCTCPVGTDCKHVAAVLLAARWGLGLGGAAPTATPEWEQVLADIVRQDAPVAHGVPLGLQLEAVRAVAGEGARVRLRPVVPGRRDNWVRTGISWADLRYAYTDRLVRAHREALQELFLAHRTGAGYTYGDVPVFLDEFGPALWPLLRRVVDAGVAFVPARGTGPVQLAAEPARAVVDLARTGEGDLEVTAALRLPAGHDGGRLLGLLGRPGHGVAVEVPAPGSGPAGLLLAPLAEPLTKRAGALVDAGRVLVPAADAERFLREYYPGLRRVLPVESTDGTVELPEVAPPRLALRLVYGPGHRLDLAWSFRYDLGGAAQVVPLDDAAATAARDTAAEAELLRALTLPADAPAALWAPGPAPALAATAVLRGLEAAVFTEEVLPTLRDQGVVVEIEGEAREYRRSDAAPVIRVSAQDSTETDWFDLGVTVELDGEEIPFEPLFVALARGESHLVLDSGTYFALARPELEQLRRLIAEAAALEDRPPHQLRLSAYQAGLWEELRELGVVETQSARWAGAVAHLLDGETAAPPPVPAGLAAHLRPYQRDGYRWLSYLWEAGLGGILADDMGLGKTLQTLAAVCRAQETGRLAAPVLVVAPTSVVGNWAAEAARFAPGLTVRAVTETVRRAKRPLADDVAGAHVVVTSYALFRIDFAAYAALPWSALVLDEAQFVKNHQAQTYQCARRLAAPFKLAITGTPLENSLMDLWALLSIVAPGLFPDPARFTETYRKPIERGEDPALLATLRRRITPFIRRRTKEQVATELPAKQEQVLRVQLNPRHRKVYQRHLQRERRKVLSLVDDLEKNRFTILRSLTLLRQLSLDPALVDEEYAGISSSKADVFLEQLQEVVDGGHRALVFSQFTGFLGTIRARLEAAGIAYAYLDGRTRDRARRIEQFKTGDAPVFLISLKAGGFGLNLTEADYCFILDPWWNPAAEAQAVDRAHRIGQDKRVMVYRMVADETIEEKVLALQERKRDLFDRVVDDGDALAAPLSAEDIRALLVS
ncbi:DEAD/DEAH box helicase [Georgenia ruanii]|uniref:DEAD/DEAH box helicase n=1 Tax=Georgenia ruanii TaxID=348442 RepID=UPI001D00EE69|nr:DEAD/DEAH box helicase [Georgenia ruanii]